MPTTKLPVLDDGFVRLEYYAPTNADLLLQKHAAELMIVNAARVSFNKRKDKVDEGDEKLISFLLSHRHGTPFEMVEFCFHVRVPIFVTREWHRHRIASYNEMSGRYVELSQAFYVPDPMAIRTQVGKPGAYRYERMANNRKVVRARRQIEQAYNQSSAKYKKLLALGVAKELARIVLPVGIYTEFYFKTNARSLMNFLSLRNAPNAMWEIQEYARAIETMFQERLPITHAAFVKHGRMAP